MRITFCGVRGSTPAAGTEFAAHGGNTSCLAVTAEGDDRPRLVLDAGTGIRAVTGLLGGDPFRGTILLTHLHWDHLQGLPFFGAADRPDAVTTVLGPGGPLALRQTIARAMSPPHFPIGPDGLLGRWEFTGIAPGDHEVEGFRVTAVRVPHKGGRTFGYRITEVAPDGAGVSLAYVPDHLPAPFGGGAGGATAEAVRQLVAGVDLLVHDAQFLDDEVDLAHHYGHSTVGEAVELAQRAGVGRLVLFHHSPARTDRGLEEIVRSLRDAPLDVCAAAEGVVVELRARSAAEADRDRHGGSGAGVVLGGDRP